MSLSIIFKTLYKHTQVLQLLSLVGFMLFPLSGFTFPLVYEGPEPNTGFKHGRVLARSIVIDPDTNQPTLVEYNTDGTEAGVVATQGYSTNELAIVPAADYYAYEQQLDGFNTQYADTLATDTILISRSEFLSTLFLQQIIPPPLQRHWNQWGQSL